MIISSDEMACKESRFIFAPAISEEIINHIYAGRFKLNWWSENAPFQHHAGLLSSYYLYNRTDDIFKDFRERIRFPRTSLLIADSIGYELFSEKAKNNHAHNYLIKELTPKKILSLQETIADIGIISDIPPFLDNSHNTTPAFFQEAMLRTAENTRIMLENRKSKHLKLYGVLQGKERYQLMNWWQTMKDYKVDGWALAAKGKFRTLISYIYFLLENNISAPVHFLGVGNSNALSLIIYLMRKDENGAPYFPNLITADSSSYNSGAIYGKIVGKDPSVCDCSLTYLHDLCKKEVGVALSLHNLYYTLNHIETLTSLIVEDVKKYKEYALTNSGAKHDEMAVYFEIVDSMIAEKRRKLIYSASASN